MKRVRNLSRKRQSLRAAAAIVRNAGAGLSPISNREAVAEARRIASDLEEVVDDLDEIDRLPASQANGVTTR